MSTKGSVALIRDAKARGVQVTAETCPHYLLLTDKALESQDADYRMNPPLREEEDRLALIEGLQDGTLDAIATDHAPHTPQEKADFRKAPNGSIGMETSLAATLTALEGVLTLPQILKREHSPCPARASPRGPCRWAQRRWWSSLTAAGVGGRPGEAPRQEQKHAV